MITRIRNYITLRRVEKALGFKLHKWQVNYIFGYTSNMTYGGRACGKTLAHQLKLLLNYKLPPIAIYPLSEFREFTDMPWSSLEYAKWYSKELYVLYHTLQYHNIKLRRVIFDRRGVR